MKITNIEFKKYQVRKNGIPWTMVKVHTDEGIVGYGEPVLEGRARTMETAVMELGDYIMGMDPRDVERLWQLMYKGSFYRGGAVMASAVSGVEQALWDIAGKWYGVPAYKLMGGAVRDRIRIYAHCEKDYPGVDYNNKADLADARTSLVQQAKERKAAGFNAIKTAGAIFPLRVVDTPEAVLYLADNIGAMREAVGPEIDIAIDMHGRFSPAMAKKYIHETEQYHPMFYEEPVLPGNDDVMADIAHRTHIPIATGERLFTRWDFRNIVEKRAADILQPDVCHAGGILELRKIAAMSEVNFCGFAPHNPMGAVALAASFQADAATINFLIQEHSSLGEGILKKPFEMDADGFIPVPQGPGLGVEPDEEALETYPKTGEGHLPYWIDRDDGSYAQW